MKFKDIRPFLLSVLAAGLICAPLLAYYKAEDWVKAAVNQKGGTVAHVSVGWPTVTLHTVNVDRGWVQASFNTVEVDLVLKGLAPEVSAVRAQKGLATVDLDQRQSATSIPSETGGFELEADFVSIEVKYQGHEALAERVLVTKHQACANTVTTEVPHLRDLELRDVCFNRSTKEVDVGDVTFTLTPPKLVGPQNVRLSQVTVYPDKSLRVTEVKVGELLEAQNVTASYPQRTVYAQVVGVRHPWLSDDTAWFHQVKGVLPKALSEDFEISLDGTTVRGNVLEQRLEGHASCTAWARALPQPMSEDINPEHFTGDLGFRIQAKPEPIVQLEQTCRHTCALSPTQDLKKPFVYEAYDSDGEPFLREAGPGTKDWVPIKMLPVNVPSAFISLEDPSFLQHKGVLPASLRVAFTQTLERGEFYRGGSTITQQLAKNLWLKRHKTLVRKAEEAFLTFALESCLDKSQILELYLNVVEFGPDVYGIGPAAKYHFQKEPGQLSLDEAYYLASILPRPKSSLSPGQGGLQRARKIMTLLAQSNRIPEAYAPVDPGTLDMRGWTALE